MQWSKSRARDPVCGTYVDIENAVTRTVQGRTFYFCEETCAEKFLEQALLTVKEAEHALSRKGSGDVISQARENIQR